jgi:sigma-B regulation protein RsbU (phosphoserine phosphatase)
MIHSKSFYRSLEKVFTGAGRVKHRERFAQRIAPALLEVLKEPLGITAVHVYERRKGDGFGNPKTWGERRSDIGDDLTRRFLSTGDDRISELPWAGDVAGHRVGLMGVGGVDGPLLVIFARPRGAGETGASRTDLVSTLNSLLYAMRQHLEKSELHDLIEQARAIQLSLLPAARCDFDGYDIHSASFPASSVGGDLYDYLPLSPDVLGLAVADASGHGLPAALQARDVAVGLRMGAERDLKIVSTIERLNRVVHRSGLTSRFVSLMFGELENNGNFAYVNAGHPPALLLDKDGVRELSVGGMVLGPDPKARFKLGYVHVDRGASMVLYTDGVIERGTTWGEEFGMSRLRKWLKDTRKHSAEAAVEDLMNRLDAHSPGKPFEDDVTVLVVRRLP